MNLDYYTRPILADGTDGEWEPCNPINEYTGLFYDASLNSNDNDSKKTIPDWYDLLQKFVHHGYQTALTGAKASDHPLLLVERSYNPPATRQQIVECLFEELQVPATFLSKDAVLSCYGSGRTSATVIDMGYTGATVTPVFDGYVEAKGIRRNPGASLQAMDEMILQNLDKLYAKRKKQKGVVGFQPLYQLRTRKTRKPPFHNAARLFVAWVCRETGCGATINTTPGGTTMTATTTTTAFHAPSKPYELPDGTTLDVPSADRFRAANLLYGNDVASQTSREDRLRVVQEKINEYISTTSSSEDDAILSPEDSKQLADEAVGIVSQGRNRGAEPVPKTKRSARMMQRATHPCLQTLMDDQLTASSLAAMVCDSAYRCDRDQQATLLSNVVVGGGGSCLGPTEQAVPDQIKESVESIIHQHTPGWRVKVLAPGVQERAILSWLGGSILGSLGSFHEMWITRAEYEEWGSSIVNRKCP